MGNSYRIVENFGYVHLSAGDLLRAERKAPGSQVQEMRGKWRAKDPFLDVSTYPLSVPDKCMNHLFTQIIYACFSLES